MILLFLTVDTYLDDPDIAERFAFLLEGNNARRAVSRSADLREIIMEPVDIEEIKRKISSLESQRSEIDEKISDIESKKQRLPELEKEKRILSLKYPKKEKSYLKKRRKLMKVVGIFRIVKKKKLNWSQNWMNYDRLGQI